MINGLPGGYNRLVHPLAQIEAAYAFCEAVEAFVADTWVELYIDPPPDEEQLEDVEPDMILDVIAKLGLRFELAGYMQSEDDIGDGYWERPYGGSWVDVLLYSWVHKVMDATGLDDRAFTHGLAGVDLIFVPDDIGVASAAHFLTLGGEDAAVRQRVDKEAARYKKLRTKGMPEWGQPRGAGPRASGRTMADKIALALKAAAGTALSAEDVAKRIKHDNVASVTAALHQITAYGKPKRLVGWLVRVGAGRYGWADGPSARTTSTKGATGR